MAKITIDDLGNMIKDGFDGVNKKFDGVNKKIDKMGKDIAEIKMKMAYVAWQIDMEEVKERLTKVEKKIGLK